MRLIYTETALLQLERFSPVIQNRIFDKMDWFVAQPNPLSFAKPLSGYNTYRFRVGDHRILCTLMQGQLFVRLIGKRDEVYKIFRFT